MIKTAIIKRLTSGKYRLYSRKKNPKTQKRRNLGTFNSLSAAKKHEKDIQFFKQHADDNTTVDKETEILEDMERVAEFLESAGFIEEAQVLYDTMACIDESLEEERESESLSLDQIPDRQLNADNINNTDSQEFGQFGVPEAEKVAFLRQLTKLANELDQSGLIEEADELDEILKKLIEQYEEQDNIDMAVNSNGLQGTSVTDNQNCGMFSGFSDSYMYGGTGYEALEGAYGPREELDRKLTI